MYNFVHPHLDNAEGQKSADMARDISELGSCSFAKTVLMILVVIYHSILFWRGNWFTRNPAATAEPLALTADFLISFLMYGFVLISGYIFYYQRCECGKYGKLIPFIINKAKRLLLPYLFVSIVWVIPIQCIFFDYTLAELIKNFLFAVSPNQLWFLWMLFDIFIIFHLLTKFIEKNTVLSLGLVLIMFAIGTVAPVIPNVFMIWNAFTYAPSFWLGFKLRQYGTQRLRKIPLSLCALLHLLLFIAGKLLPMPGGIIGKGLTLGITFVTNHIGAISAFLILTTIGAKINTGAPLLNVLGKSSMTVYLFHQQIIYPFIYLLNGFLNPYLIAIIAFVGAMLISLLISALLSKFNITRLLIGEKPLKKQEKQA